MRGPLLLPIHEVVIILLGIISIRAILKLLICPLKLLHVSVQLPYLVLDLRYHYTLKAILATLGGCGLPPIVDLVDLPLDLIVQLVRCPEKL